MSVFKKASWIWCNKESSGDEYCEFYKEFTFEGGKAFLNLACDSDYTLFVNGKFFECNQFFGYEHYKVYDRLDITPLLNVGVNSISVLVWHIGDCKYIQRYFFAKQGLIFEICDQNGKELAVSDIATMSRLSPTYKSGYKKLIATQIGYSFLYDATKEDCFPQSIDSSFSPSCTVDKKCDFFERGTKKLCLAEKCKAEIIRVNADKTKYLIDLGRETVGLPHIELTSQTEQKLTVAYSECLENDQIRRFILSHDYSYEYVTKKGENNFTHYMLRLACRYLEISGEEPFELSYCGIIPQYYPIKEKEIACENKLDRDIYEICMRTLKLCMLEHYVDCPWREQCLYTYDSRNQMLCGYYAFEDGNFQYAKANLELISQDSRQDKLLSICFPCAREKTIPAYSLYYILAVKEYIEHTGDIAFAKKKFKKLDDIISVFTNNMSDGLLCKLTSSEHWNFYDWSEYLSGSCAASDDSVADVMIHLITVMALDCFEYICKKTENPFPYSGLADAIRQNINQTFFRKSEGAYAITKNGNEFTEFANAFAVLTDTATGEAADRICENLLCGKWSECSLSMKTFIYDALLKNNLSRYSDVVLSDIRKNYSYMLDAGATSVWETLKGYKDQEGSGSLCHGWSAIPVYYYRKLGVVS